MAHEVFISHSSKDQAIADAVCAALEVAGITCWIAPRDIAAGREWAEAIIDGLAQSRVLLLVLTAAANESPQIAREVERAASKGLSIVPLRIEDVVPGKSLEYFIGPVHWLDALTPPVETHLDRLVATVRETLAAAPDRRVPSRDTEARAITARWNAFRARLRFGTAAAIVSIGVALLASVLAVLSVLDFFTLDTRIDTYTMALGNLLVRRTVSPDLVLLAVDKDADHAAWRRAHAAVVERLTRAGTKVVVFDLFFETPSPHDADFRRTVEAARGRGTAVIVGARSMAGGRPRLVPDLAESVSAWGALCLGRELGYAWMGPVAVQPTGQAPIPSLALAALAAFRELQIVHVPVKYREVVSRDLRTGQTGAIPVSATQRFTEVQSRCPIISGQGDIATLMIDLSPLPTLRERPRRLAYADVLAAPDEALAPLRGKIVLIGAELPEDQFGVGALGEERYGFELHADALNTLLTGVTIRPLGAGGQVTISIALALLGGFLRYWRPPARRRRRAVLVGVCALYFMACVVIYAQARLLLNVPYHLGGLLGAYVLVGQVERRWFPETVPT